MADLLTDPFATALGQRALAEVVVLAALAGPLGVWIVVFRHGYTAESISHGMLPGLVVAALVGVPLLAGAAAGVAVAAVAIALAARSQRIARDTAVAVAVTSLFGLGALLALRPDVPARLGELLFGDLLAVGEDELAVSAALAIAGLVCVVALHRPLTLAAFDPATAAGLGARPQLVELALLALLATWVVAAVGALGALLVVALLVAPAAAALRLAPGLGAALALAAMIAAGSGVGGLYLSHHLHVAAGASVALVALAAFVAALPMQARGARSSG